MRSMKEDRTPTASLLVVLLFVGSLLVAYVAGYFWLGDYDEASWALRRGYRHKFTSDLYKPSAWIETKLRGQAVETWWMNEPDPL